MKHAMTVLVLAMLLVPSSGRSQPSSVCPQFEYLPIKPIAEVRIIFVSFDAHSIQGPPCCECQDPVANNSVPPWASDFATSFGEYIAWATNGQTILNVRVLDHPDGSGQTWRPSSPSVVYKNDCSTGATPNYGDLNAELITMIADEYQAAGQGAVWANVDGLLVFNYERVWPGSGFLGVGNLALPAGFDRSAYQFNAAGATMMLGCWEIDDLQVPGRVESAAAHEFGHLLGLRHIPETAKVSSAIDAAGNGFMECGSPALDPKFVNMGHYSIMQSSRPPTSEEEGFVGYHPKSLVSLGTPQEIVNATCAVQTVRIPDVHNVADGKVVQIALPGTTQYFLLSNHQGTRDGSIYGGSGLLIWHISNGKAWDLESARGKQIDPTGTGGTPDPATWWDPLEADICERGTALDFYDGSPGRDAFTPWTNPSSNLYEPNSTSEGIVSGLHLENIRYDAGGSDVLVDVFLDPTSEVWGVSENARVEVGRVIRIEWTSCASIVDINLVNTVDGSVRALENDIQNASPYIYVVAIQDVGSSHRFDVIPDNDPSATMSSAVFMASGITAMTVTKSFDTSGNVVVTGSWTTSEVPNSIRGTVFNTADPSMNQSILGTVVGVANSLSMTLAPCVEGAWEYGAISSIDDGLGGVLSLSRKEPFDVSSCTPPPPCRRNCNIEQSSVVSYTNGRVGLNDVWLVKRIEVPNEGRTVGTRFIRDESREEFAEIRLVRDLQRFDMSTIARVVHPTGKAIADPAAIARRDPRGRLVSVSWPPVSLAEGERVYVAFRLPIPEEGAPRAGLGLLDRPVVEPASFALLANGESPTGLGKELAVMLDFESSDGEHQIVEGSRESILSLRMSSLNPFRASAVVELSLPVQTSVKVEVFDVSGRRVRVVQRGDLSAGRHTVRWDGRSEAGDPVAAGVYFVRLTTPRGARSVKLMKLR